MYNLQLFKFETPDHLFLPGLLYEPPTKTKKVAIYLHGNGSSSVFYSVERNNIFAQELNKQGISFFPFNNRGAHIVKTLTRKIGDQEERVNQGMAYELIKDCVLDIEGALNFLETQGYNEFYLIGQSTGTNKIVLYNYLKSNNRVNRYILTAGGDDAGIYYRMFGSVKLKQVLKACKQKIQKGNGTDLVPEAILSEIMSYQSLYDTINPDGEYNIFPYNEYLNNLKLATKELFREYKNIKKPSLVVYGEHDEFCEGKLEEYVNVLKELQPNKSLFTYKIIPDTDHGFTGKEKEMTSVIASWLAK